MIACVAHCSEKAGKQSAEPATELRENSLPPTGSAADAPEYVRSLSLLYPQAEIYRVENRIIQKSNHPLTAIADYYKKALARHDFALTTRLEQSSGALLQFERAANAVAGGKSGNGMPQQSEVISVDISKLPYADNYLIRIGRSEVDYNRGKSP